MRDQIESESVISLRQNTHEAETTLGCLMVLHDYIKRKGLF